MAKQRLHTLVPTHMLVELAQAICEGHLVVQSRGATSDLRVLPVTNQIHALTSDARDLERLRATPTDLSLPTESP